VPHVIYYLSAVLDAESLFPQFKNARIVLRGARHDLRQRNPGAAGFDE